VSAFFTAIGGLALVAAIAQVPVSDTTDWYHEGDRHIVIYGSPLYLTDITLDRNETVMTLALGDPSEWIVARGVAGPHGSIPHVFVKPRQDAESTNLEILTDRHEYMFWLVNDAKHYTPRVAFYPPLTMPPPRAVPAVKPLPHTVASTAATPPALAAPAPDTREVASAPPSANAASEADLTIDPLAVPTVSATAVPAAPAQRAPATAPLAGDTDFDAPDVVAVATSTPAPATPAPATPAPATPAPEMPAFDMPAPDMPAPATAAPATPAPAVPVAVRLAARLPGGGSWAAACAIANRNCRGARPTQYLVCGPISVSHDTALTYLTLRGPLAGKSVVITTDAHGRHFVHAPRFRQTYRIIGIRLTLFVWRRAHQSAYAALDTPAFRSAAFHEDQR
jgi:hypothetical protein